MNLQSILIDIGLTPGEAKVYLALLKLGPSTTGPIVKHARVSRSKVYEMLDRLQDRGLVGIRTEQKTTHYVISNPQDIKKHLDNRIEILKEKQRSFLTALPELKRLHSQQHRSNVATVFTGIKGVKSVFTNMLDQLSNGDEYYATAIDPEQYTSHQFRAFINQHHKKRQAKGIKVKLLASEKMRNHFTKDFANMKLIQTRFTKSELPASTLIYPNAVATYVWSENPSGSILSSKIVYQRYKKFFLDQWKNAK